MRSLSSRRPRRAPLKLRVAVVRPLGRFLPRDWDNIPARGEVHTITDSPSKRVGLAVVAAFNRLKLSELANDARPQRLDRWAVLIDGKSSRVVGNQFIHQRVRD